MLAKLDTSTIDSEALAGFPALRLPTHYSLGSMGMGCFLEPPGHPSYFIQPVYTPAGHNPRRKGYPRVVLSGRVLQKVGDGSILPALMNGLWRRLPYDHPRVLAWIESMYHHYRGAYDDKGERVFRFQYNDRKRTFEDHPGFRESWRKKERAAIAAYNEEVDLEWRRVAVPENLSVVRLVRNHYPEHQPRLDLLDARDGFPPPGWWSVLSARPAPSECPGMVGQVSTFWRHPVNGTWCQVCGWRKE